MLKEAQEGLGDGDKLGMPQNLYLDDWKEVGNKEEDECGDAQCQPTINQMRVVAVHHRPAGTTVCHRTITKRYLVVEGLTFMADDKVIECLFIFNFHGYNYSQ